MPRRSKKAWRWMNWEKPKTNTHADVTLDDFANSSTSGARLRKAKATSNCLVREVNYLRGSSTVQKLDWLEECDQGAADANVDEITSNIPCELEEDETEVKPIEEKPKKESKRRLKKSTKKTVDNDDDDANVYPLDIWFVLSDYIKPEDVLTFASICKGALTAVNSTRFWLQLYRRYYKSNVDLPERLQPECMERPRCLRACVIRSLYYTYPSFADRLGTVSHFEDKYDNLVRSRCILTWHQNAKNVWNLYFKFQRGKLALQRKRERDLIRMLDDIYANSEDGYQILQVSCKNFILTPVVIGLILSSVSFNVNRFQLQLVFESSHATGNPDRTLVILEPAVRIRVLDWWHPEYPHSIK